MDRKLTCPNCGSENVTVTEEAMWMVNTMEHYCHSVKAHDNDAKSTCLACDWIGCRDALVEKLQGV